MIMFLREDILLNHLCLVLISHEILVSIGKMTNYTRHAIIELLKISLLPQILCNSQLQIHFCLIQI